MKTIKNITLTLITLSLISFLATTGAIAEPNSVKGEESSVSYVRMTDAHPAGVEGIYLNGK